jgi:micrococcal nuclease
MMHLCAMSPPLIRALAPRLVLFAAVAAGLLVLAFGLRPVIPAAEGARGFERGASGPAPRRMAGPYRAEAIRVVDGDTFEARLRIWFNQEVIVLIRLDGVDAPELKGRCPQETRLAQEARDALTAILTSGAVSVRDLHADKYNGRAVARAVVADGSSLEGDDVGALLIAGGYARAYDGRARSPWCGAAPALLADGKRAR